MSANEHVIHVDGQEFKVSQATMSGAEIKALVHKDATYQLFEELTGQDQDRLIPDTQSVTIRNGLHFYTVPPATFGFGYIGPHFDALKAKFPAATLEQRPDGSYLVNVPDVGLPPGWIKPKSTVTFIVPTGYPHSRPDCFWADADLRLASGGMPANTGLNSNYGGPETKLWFSYHPGSWNPNLDNLLTYVNLIKRRLQEVR